VVCWLQPVHGYRNLVPTRVVDGWYAVYERHLYYIIFFSFSFPRQPHPTDPPLRSRTLSHAYIYMHAYRYPHKVWYNVQQLLTYDSPLLFFFLFFFFPTRELIYTSCLGAAAVVVVVVVVVVSSFFLFIFYPFDLFHSFVLVSPPTPTPPAHTSPWSPSLLQPSAQLYIPW